MLSCHKASLIPKRRCLRFTNLEIYHSLFPQFVKKKLFAMLQIFQILPN